MDGSLWTIESVERQAPRLILRLGGVYNGEQAILQAKLKTITDNVYFQPPEGLKMQYPCIVYSRDYAVTEFANDNPYHYTQRYQLIVIDQDPDSEILAQIAALPMCTFTRHFAASNLNHDVYAIYF